MAETTAGQTAAMTVKTVALTDDTGTSGIIERLKAEAAEKTARRKREGRKPFEELYGSLKDCYAVKDDPIEFVKECRGEWPNPWEDSI
ncbi:MAG: hypothetical protein LBK61_03370 [Spirochaetaceae bacterium]|jgi:hypothetical protein|nr:hypothetical protein [Spirochaetaceae bacterium]